MWIIRSIPGPVWDSGEEKKGTILLGYSALTIGGRGINSSLKRLCPGWRNFTNDRELRQLISGSCRCLGQ